MSAQPHKLQRKRNSFMHRFAVVVAMLGIAVPTRALADPFEHLSSRLADYEEQIESGAVFQQPPAESAAPEAVPEGAELVPTPIPQPSEELGFYPGDGVWEEPMMGGCYDGCCHHGEHLARQAWRPLRDYP